MLKTGCDCDSGPPWMLISTGCGPAPAGLYTQAGIWRGLPSDWSNVGKRTSVGERRDFASMGPISLCVQRSSLPSASVQTQASFGCAGVCRLKASRLPAGSKSIDPMTPNGNCGGTRSARCARSMTPSRLAPSSLTT